MTEIVDDHIVDEPTVSTTSQIGTFSGAELRMFTRTGIVPGPTGQSLDLTALHPVVLHPYIAGNDFETPYPLILQSESGGLRTISLSDMIQSMSEALDSEGDQLELEKRALTTLERVLNESVSGDSLVGLKKALDRVESRFLKSANGKREKANAYRTVLDIFKSSILPESQIVPFSPRAMAELLACYVHADLDQRSAGLRKSIDWFIISLSDLIRVETNDSPAGQSIDTLKHIVGGAYSEEFDFNSLSELLGDGPHGAPLEAERLDRITSCLESLKELSQNLFGERKRKPLTKINDVHKEIHARVEHFTDLVRAVEIARLEVENRYRPEVHDDRFSSFSPDSIEPEYRQAFPPILCYLSATGRPQDFAKVNAALQSSWPVKLILAYDSVFEEDGRLSAASSLAGSTVSTARVFVQQSCLSDAAFLSEGIEGASAHAGSSLISIYVGSDKAPDYLNAYLRSAIASDSRSVPAFRYHPDPDTEWVDQFSGNGNEQPEKDWPVAKVNLAGNTTPSEVDAEPGGDSERSDSGRQGAAMELAFSAADALVCDTRFTHHFLPFRLSEPEENTYPITDYLALDADKKYESIPFIWLEDVEGQRIQCAVSPRVVEITQTIRSRWKMIQEWSGIRSSIATRAVDIAETASHEIQKKAIQDVTEEYEDRLSATTESMAREIVDNIAQGLLGISSASLSTLRVVAKANTDPVSTAVGSGPVGSEEVHVSDEHADAAPVADADDEDDIALPLDDAYIDTPLCTTCNECTDLNSLIFAYNGDKQATVKDASAGPFSDIVKAAENCPVRIIHPGKPVNRDEKGVDEWIERSKPFL